MADLSGLIILFLIVIYLLKLKIKSLASILKYLSFTAQLLSFFSLAGVIYRTFNDIGSINDRTIAIYSTSCFTILTFINYFFFFQTLEKKKR